MRERFVDSGGVRIHVVEEGPEDGPPVVFVHGFPEFWWSWRHQLTPCAEAGYRAVAVDLRGFGGSDRPDDVEAYALPNSLADVTAVIDSVGGRATLVSHDWGGAVAWQFATRLPEMTEKLVILNLPHPSGLSRELAENPKQREASAYTPFFQQEGAHEALSAERLARWVSDPEAQKNYVEAFRRSDFEAMLYYYKRHYPREPYRPIGPPEQKVRATVLQIYGLLDPYLLPGALNNAWEYVDADFTLVTVPGAGHFVQQDAAGLVTRIIAKWLAQ